jgi:serine/threonine protein kinase
VPDQTTVGPRVSSAAQTTSGARYRSAGALESHSLSPGTLVGGRYEVAEELGRGAFGVVYRALDTRLGGSPVAIKVLLDTALATPDAVRRFRAEGEVLCKVRHAHVPAVLDIGEIDGRQYIALAFVQGKAVKELIPPGGWQDPVAAVQLTAKLVRTLHDIYSQWSILHRDVKPANMMVPDSQQDGLYLMDFGLAVCNRSDTTRTQDGTVLGTPAYMSPEQARGQITGTSHPADLYSAAAVLYHLLTGRPPFTSPLPQLLLDILLEPPAPPSKYRAGLDAELDAIVLKGLSKEPSGRFATGADFAARLDLWAARALVSRSGDAPPAPRPVLQVRPASAPKAAGESSVAPRSTARSSVAKPPAAQHAPQPVRPEAGPSAVRVKPLAAPAPPGAKAPARNYRPLLFKLGAVAISLTLVAIAGGVLWSVVRTPSEKKPNATELPQGDFKPWERK